VTFLPPTIQDLFTRAFTNGAHDPTTRPTAAQWRQALTGLRITSCDREPNHQIPEECSSCPWCAIDAERQTRRRNRTLGLVRSSRPYGDIVDYPVFAPSGGVPSWPSPISVAPSTALSTPVAGPGGRRVNIAPKATLAAAMLLLIVLGFIAWAGDGSDTPVQIGPVTAKSDVDGGTRTGTNSSSGAWGWPGSTRTPADPEKTDVHGSVNYTDARCGGEDLAAVTARTSKSALVICRASDSDTYYYKRFQPPMGEATVLRATRQGTGFEVIDHSDGSQDEVTPAGLTILKHGAVVATEPTLQYVTNP
jgi:hypothetical protein